MFSGYILHSEVVRAVSDSPVGPFTFAETILPCSSPDAWDGRMAHNPTIRKFGDTYLLYYIGSTYHHPEGAEDSNAMCAESYANIRIGLATSTSVFGPWQVHPNPILDIRPGKWDNKIVTNPAPVIRPDGEVLLYYRSNTPHGLRIGIAGADTFDGPYRRLRDNPILVFESGDYIEDPFVWWNLDHYEMLAKDMLGGLTGERHAGAHFYSRNGLDWNLMQPAKAYSRKVVYEGGKVVTLGCLERPQLLFDRQERPSHLFAAAANGPGGFRNADHTWNISIPIKQSAD